MEKLSLIIPAFNEGKIIHRISDQVKAVEFPSGIAIQYIKHPY